MGHKVEGLNGLDLFEKHGPKYLAFLILDLLKFDGRLNTGTFYQPAVGFQVRVCQFGSEVVVCIQHVLFL